MDFQWNNIIPNLTCVTPEGVATLNCLPALFVNIVNALLGLSGAAALFLVIYSGIKLITSGGEAKQVEGARHTLTYAVLGLVIVLTSFIIINIISTVTGLGCIKEFGFTNCSAPTSNSSSSSTPTQTCAQAQGFCVNEDLCPSGSHEIFGATCPGSSQICCK